MGKILLIEPDRMLAQMYCQIFVAAGHRVVPCASAQAAVMAADELQPDAVVLELQLIEHSGLEFLYEFRSYAEWQAIPIIVHSTVPPSEFSGGWRLLQSEIGVAAYLYKPHTTLRQLLSVTEDQLALTV